MRSEHLSNVHLGWDAVGWVAAIAVAGGLHLSLVATGFVPAGVPEVIANAAAVLIGFFAGGFFVGMRWSEAPVLNGAAIALVSAVIWLATAVLATGDLSEHLGSVDTATTLGSLLLQMGGGVAGALAGRATVLRGHVPEPESLPPEA